MDNSLAPTEDIVVQQFDEDIEASNETKSTIIATPVSNSQAPPNEQYMTTPVSQMKLNSASKSSCFNNHKFKLGTICACYCCYWLCTVVGFIVLQTFLNPPFDPDFDIDLPDSSEEVRNGDDHVGILFAVEPNAVERAAFVTAAERWSNIVRGTEISGGFVNQGEDVCRVGIRFSNRFFVDHLVIISVVDSIDGVNGILAQAGPCIADEKNPLSSFPAIGVMIFDSDDVNSLVIDGTFESVILHEMGHVLGVGTLWSNSVQGKVLSLFNSELDDRLLINPVLDPITGQVSGLQKPEFIGSKAVSAFSAAGGLGFVPVEDGIFPQGNNFNNENGAGSVDGHWNLEDFDNELMVFSINPANGVFPLSVITIRSLEDLGYTVDISFADNFDLPTLASKAAKKSINTEKSHNLVHDTLNIELLPFSN